MIRLFLIRTTESFAPSRRRDVQVGAQEGPALARHVLHRARRSARHDVHHELAAEIVGALGKISVSATRQGGGGVIVFFTNFEGTSLQKLTFLSFGFVLRLLGCACVSVCVFILRIVFFVRYQFIY